MSDTIFQEIDEHGSHCLENYLRKGGDPHVIDSNTHATLLHAAGKLGAINLCQKLKSYGLSITQKDRYGNSPFHYANLGWTLRKKQNMNPLSKDEVLQYQKTLRLLYLESDIGIPIDKFFGVTQ